MNDDEVEKGEIEEADDDLRLEPMPKLAEGRDEDAKKGVSEDLVKLDGEDEETPYQFSIATVMLLTAIAASFFAIESLTRETSSARLLMVPIGLGVAVTLTYLASREHRLLVSMLLAAYFSSLVGRSLGWNALHVSSFTMSAMLTAYFFADWLGVEVRFDLLSPLLAMGLLALLGVLVWLGNFGRNADPDASAIALTVLFTLPYAAGVVFRLMGLN